MASTIKRMIKPRSDSPSDRPRKTGILPPNDPERKDWGILSDSLGLKEHARPNPGATVDEAAAQMKDLLLKVAADNKAYEALIMKCAGTRIGALVRSENGGNGTYDNVMAFLKSRLWNRRADGVETQSRVGKQFSSNQVLQAWEPKEGGIATY